MALNSPIEEITTDVIQLTFVKQTSNKDSDKQSHLENDNTDIEATAPCTKSPRKNNRASFETDFTVKLQHFNSRDSQVQIEQILANIDESPQLKKIYPPGKHISVIQNIEEGNMILNQKIKAPRPPLPKKQLIISFSLLILGFILLLIGMIRAISASDPNSGIALWAVGALCAIPGGVYAFKFCKVRYATCPEVQRKALEQIPRE